jgi:hypothetical protein
MDAAVRLQPAVRMAVVAPIAVRVTAVEQDAVRSAHPFAAVALIAARPERFVGAATPA